MIRREPLGVVGQVAPWNYPLMMAVWKFAPALAAGNVSVLKPSEQTPLSTLRFAQLAADVIPPGVLNVITGDGEPVGAGIVSHPDVRLVSLTGDVATGKEVARAAAETLKRVHLELGGKAPVVVFDDADPGPGRGGDQDRRLLELRPGLHGRLARRGRAEDLRPAARGARAGGRVAPRRRPGRGRRDRDGPGDLARPSRTACSASSTARRARRCSPAAGRTATAASSSSRPSSPRSARRTRSSSARCSARRHRSALRRRRPGARVGERRPLRARGVGLHARHLTRAQRGAQARVRHRLDQRPHPAGLGDAARRLQAVRLRQGPLDVLARGLHADQARDGEAGLSVAEEKSEQEAAAACGSRRTSASTASRSASTTSSRSTTSASRSRTARSSRCSGRRAAARRRRCG